MSRTLVRTTVGALARAGMGVLVAAAGSPLGAQTYFGQNQVQYDNFKWKVLETEHFLVHYYPEEGVAVEDAARMAERGYARLSRMLNHQFREKKPLILFASRTDFGQNNIFGDLGEGTGGITEALRHRIVLPFTGDYKSFEHVLQHELVHAFQYDIFARGRAGGGLQTLAQVQPPYWFMEGMAEYLSLGPNVPMKNTVLRDAALNGRIPTIEKMTYEPDRYFPYDYGYALWEYVGQRWGDDVIGEIMNSVPSVGIERAFKRELGLSLEELGDEWKEWLQTKHLPQVAERDRARKFAEPLLNDRRTGGRVFIAPTLSNDGKYIAFISTGSFLRGEVFPDIWLGDAQTGKRLKRLVKSTTDPNVQELRMLYSQSAFSPDGRYLAFTGQADGKDVMYLLDVKKQKRVRRYELPLEGVTGPSFSPDGQRIVFSGNDGGITDLYMVDVDGKNFKRLTNDRYGDLQPQWSPDGKSVVFASDRGELTDFTVLRFNKWRIAVMNLETGRIEVLPAQAGMNLNPQWSPDGRAVAYISDRSGIPNLFLYDFDKHEHYRLTNVVGAVAAFTEYSPAITWAHQADRLAFAYFEDGSYTIWSVNNPRHLATDPWRDGATKAGSVIASASRPDTSFLPPVPPENAPVVSGPTARTGAAAGAAEKARQSSSYRDGAGLRASAEPPRRAAEVPGTGPLSVSQLLDSAALALPDTTKFKSYDYKVAFQPEYISQPSIGYSQDNFGRGVFGGTTVILSDLLGNSRLAFAGQINGRVSEAMLYAGYTNLAHRFQYTAGLMQQPIWFYQGTSYSDVDPADASRQWENTQLARYIVRQAFAVGLYPLNRFSRFEYGAQVNNVSRATAWIRRGLDYNLGQATGYVIDSIVGRPGLNYFAPYVAYVSDNTLFGYTGPISGRRYRFQIQPTVGSFKWVEYQADYRRYYPILFNYLTFAVRGQTSLSVGPDETEFPKYIGRPDFVRGYDREQVYYSGCGGLGNQPGACSATQLLGSRVAFANAELRFPLVRRFDLGILPISLPPVDGLFFYDVGLAWSKGQQISLRKPAGFDEGIERYPLRSYGAGIRLNLFGFALVRWDYAIPLNGPSRKGYWMWSLGPSF
jgi:Tol biopolymer transport system component